MKNGMLVLSFFISSCFFARARGGDDNVQKQQMLQLNRAILHFENERESSTQIIDILLMQIKEGLEAIDRKLQRFLPETDKDLRFLPPEDFNLMDYFLLDESAKVSEGNFCTKFKDRYNKEKRLDCSKKDGVITNFSLLASQNGKDFYYEKSYDQHSLEVKTINNALRYKMNANKDKKMMIGLEGIPDDLVKKGEAWVEQVPLSDEQKSAKIVSRVERDPDKQFVERWTCPWYVYPFAWLFYGKHVAMSRSWLWSDIKPTSHYEQEVKKVKEQEAGAGRINNQDRLGKQFRDKYSIPLIYFNNGRQISITQGLYDKVLKNLASKDDLERMHALHVAFDSFNKLVKDPEACKEIQDKRKLVGPYFNDYVASIDQHDKYLNWKKKHNVADKDVYSFKAFYNAHEEFAYATKNLLVYQEGMLKNNSLCLATKLKEYGVHEAILAKVGFEVPKQQ